MYSLLHIYKHCNIHRIVSHSDSCFSVSILANEYHEHSAITTFGKYIMVKPTHSPAI